jgi:hypothetical protein
MSERAPYSRVYWSIVDDPKFATIYDDDRHLAAWLRLLMAADGLWPASCPVPASARKASLTALTDADLIDLMPGGRFRVHGLDAERGRRRDAARTGTKRDPDGTHPVPERPLGPGTKPRRDETRRDEQTREGLPNLDREALAALETATGHVASMAGDKTLNEYDRLVGDHGLPAIVAAFGSLANGKRMTARQLVWGAVKVLEPFVKEAPPPEPKPFKPRKREPWEQELHDAIAVRESAVRGEA